MKRILPILMLLTFAAIFAGCSMDEEYIDMHENEVAVRQVTYTLNADSYDVVLRGDEEWDGFVAMLFDKVDEGCQATFRCTSTDYEPLDAKRPLTLKTGDREEAQKWASERGKEGYVVIVSYDKKNKVYKLQALKK